jgi:hypothetical protein
MTEMAALPERRGVYRRVEFRGKTTLGHWVVARPSLRVEFAASRFPGLSVADLPCPPLTTVSELTITAKKTSSGEPESAGAVTLRQV